MSFQSIRALSAFATLSVLSASTAFAAINLPAYNVDTSQTTVSGLSSGGFMAIVSCVRAHSSSSAMRWPISARFSGLSGFTVSRSFSAR